MKAKSVSVLGSVSLSKDGKSQVFRDMKHAFGHDFMQKCDMLSHAVHQSAGEDAQALMQACACRYGKAMFFLGWHEIRETLYEGLPSGVVEFGCKYDSYEEQDGAITVRFRVCAHPEKPAYDQCHGSCLMEVALGFPGALRAPAGWKQRADAAADRRRRLLLQGADPDAGGRAAALHRQHHVARALPAAARPLLRPHQVGHAARWHVADTGRGEKANSLT